MCRRVWLVAVAAIALSGCFLVGDAVDLSELISFLVDSTELDNATYNFGPVDPEADPVTAAITVSNGSAGSIAITSAEVDNPAFELGPAFPLVVDAGGSAVLSATFVPVASGSQTGTVTMTVDGFDGTLTLTLTGEGNYPPVVQAKVEVSGAGTAAANGTYVRVGSLNQSSGGVPLALYQQSASGPYIWAEDSTGITWYMGPNTTSTGEQYYSFSGPERFAAPRNNIGFDEVWVLVAGQLENPTVVGELSGFITNQSVDGGGESVVANYVYSDVEGDAEGGTSFQWYRSTDPGDGFAPIAGATSASYTPVPGDEFYYLKVRVTPAAQTGTVSGASIDLGPSPEVSFSAG